MSERVGFYRLLEGSDFYGAVQTGIVRSDMTARLKSSFFPSLGSSIRRVLDIGCGPGRFMHNWPGDYDYVGFDPNPAYIEAGRARFPSAELHVGVTSSVERDISGPFDLAAAFGVLHHVDDDEASRIVQFAFERLAPGGLMLTLDPTILRRQNPAAKLLAKLDRGKHVRPPDDYRSLVAAQFGELSTSVEVLSRLLRVPYNHAAVTARKT